MPAGLTTTESVPPHEGVAVSLPTAVDEELPANTHTTVLAVLAVAVAVPELVAKAMAESLSLAVDVAVPEVSAVEVAVLLSVALDVAVPEFVAVEVAVLLVSAVDVAVPEVLAVDVAVLPPFFAVAAAAVPPPAIEEVQVSPLPSGPRVWFPVQARGVITALAVPIRLPEHNKMESANNPVRKRPLVKYFIASPSARLAKPTRRRQISVDLG